MGQQPNVELEPADLPRPEPVPAAPQRRRAARPGEITSPEAVQWGGAFGRPGPDTGYAFRIIAAAGLGLDRGAEPFLATLMGARASLYGRAPVPEDLEVALILAGLRTAGVAADSVERLARRRARWLEQAAHEVIPGRAALTELSPDLLGARPDEVRRRLSGDQG